MITVFGFRRPDNSLLLMDSPFAGKMRWYQFSPVTWMYWGYESIDIEMTVIYMPD